MPSALAAQSFHARCPFSTNSVPPEAAVIKPKARASIYAIADEMNVDYQVIATHVGAYAVNPSPYNLADWEIEWIARRKGIAGVILMPFWTQPHSRVVGVDFLSRTIEHIRAAGGVNGDDVVAIGTDLDDATDLRMNSPITVRCRARSSGSWQSSSGRTTSTPTRSLKRFSAAMHGRFSNTAGMQIAPYKKASTNSCGEDGLCREEIFDKLPHQTKREKHFHSRTEVLMRLLCLRLEYLLTKKSAMLQ